MRKNNPVLFLFVFLFISLFSIALAPFIGMSTISFHDLATNSFQREIFFSLRLPRVLTAFVAGAGLSLCGMIFQALFRNPLADPFTLGIASGASCGAALTILAGIGGALLGIPMISIGAFTGAALSIALVYGLSSLRRNSSNITLLLAGIAVSFLFSSMLMFFQYLSNLRDSFHIIRWLMGGIEVFGYSSLTLMLIPCLLGVFLIVIKLADLDQLLAGDDLAQSRGVNVRTTKNILLIAATLIVGSIVAVCGPIGFVGLMTPHVCRTVFQTRHRLLAPSVALAGGTLLVICDTLARTVVAPAEIPVGVVTALFGGPFFLWILFGQKRGIVLG